jgi:hypothetical protein
MADVELWFHGKYQHFEDAADPSPEPDPAFSAHGLDDSNWGRSF